MRRTILLLMGLLAFAAAPAHAQFGARWDPRGLQLTREELEELLVRYETTTNSSAYSGRLRAQARAEADLIRQRLEEGDMRVGDRVLLVVEGHPVLTDTFNVVAGRRLVLPDIGEIPLEGVLRSELQPYMEQEIARYIRDPVVRARSLIRLEILGAVSDPGFFTIPSDMLLSDALMIAGGPAGNARTDRIQIERGRDVIWEGERLHDALVEGRTLDQLSIRAGDRITVPQERGRFANVREWLVLVSAVSSLVLVANRIGIF